MTPTLSQYTDTGHDTPPCHSIEPQNITPTPSQYTATGHDTPPRHSIQTQDMAPNPFTVYTHDRPVVSHWNTQLPILMSWVRPHREILPRPFTHTSERSPL